MFRFAKGNRRFFSVNKYGEWTSTKPTFYDPPSFPLKQRDESIQVFRKRLLYSSRKRGILETDLLLSSWAKDNLDNLDLKGLKEYEVLLHENDWNIYYWLTGGLEAPEHVKKLGILESLKLHSLNLDKKILKMPSL
jgi:succinate dehydrogenase assembly factor 2